MQTLLKFTIKPWNSFRDQRVHKLKILIILIILSLAILLNRLELSFLAKFTLFFVPYINSQTEYFNIKQLY